MAQEGKIDLITFDGGALVADMVQESTAEVTGELTQHAVESGTDINDHFIRHADMLSLTLVQTETPLEAIDGFAPTTLNLTHAARVMGTQSKTVPIPQPVFRPTSLLALTNALGAAVFGGPAKTLTIQGLKADTAPSTKPFTVTALGAGAPVERVNEFHNALLELFDGVVPLTVTVKGRSYPDMLITSISRNDPQGQAGCARFTVSFQRLAVAETRTVALPPVPAATAKKSKGGAPPKPAAKDLVVSAAVQVGIGLGVQSAREAE